MTRGSGSLAVIGNDGNLDWPAALSGLEFKPDRDRVTGLLREALDQARSRALIEKGTLDKLTAVVQTLKDRLRKSSRELDQPAHTEASVFLKNLEDAVKALGQPDAKDFLAGKYDLKVKTVPELVKFMTANGLRFARALPGDEAAYQSLYQAMEEYDQAVNS